MRVQTDATLRAYADAVQALPPETYRECIAYAERIAPHTDDSEDALPAALITLHKRMTDGREIDRQSIRSAVRAAVLSATRNRLRAWEAAAPTDTLPESGDAHPVADAPRWESVRESLSPTHRAMLDGIAADAVARLMAERAETYRTHPDGHTSGHAALMAEATMERRALRVGVIAASIGAPIPRSRAASDALRASACVAWATASAMLTPPRTTVRVPVPTTGQAPRWTYLPGAPESVEHRAVRAMRYVTTDATALAAAYRRERDLISGGPTTPEMVRMLGWQAPVSDPVSVSLTRSMPEPRKGPASRSRKGLVTPSVSTRHSGGIAPGAAHGASIAAEVPTDAGVRAIAAEGRRQAREDAAYDAMTARSMGSRECGRALPVPTTAPGAEWECGCGGSTLPLLSGWVLSGGAGDGTPVRSSVHRLTPCPAPAETHDSDGILTGHRCGCGRKRGALTRQDGEWAHKAR
jgi:hypothetical protein